MIWWYNYRQVSKVIESEKSTQDDTVTFCWKRLCHHIHPPEFKHLEAKGFLENCIPDAKKNSFDEI